MTNKFKLKKLLTLLKAVINGAIHNVPLSRDLESLNRLVEVIKDIVNLNMIGNEIAIANALHTIEVNLLNVIYKFAPQDSIINPILNNNILIEALIGLNIAQFSTTLKQYGSSYFVISIDEMEDCADMLIFLILEIKVLQWSKN